MIRYNAKTRVLKTDGDCGRIFLHKGGDYKETTFEDLENGDIISMPDVSTGIKFMVTRRPHFDLDLPEGTKIMEFKTIK